MIKMTQIMLLAIAATLTTTMTFAYAQSDSTPVAPDISSLTSPTLITDDGQHIYVYDSSNGKVTAYDSSGAEDTSKSFTHAESPAIASRDHMVYDDGYIVFLETLSSDSRKAISVVFDGNYNDTPPGKYDVEFFSSKTLNEASLDGHTYTLDANAKTITLTANSATPADDSATPADDSATPADDSATPADDSATPADDSATPADDSATPADDSATPADDSNEQTITPTDVPAFVLDDSKLVLKAPDSDGHLLADRYMVVYVDDINSIGNIAVHGTEPTSTDSPRLSIHDKDTNEGYIRDANRSSSGWNVTIPAANLSAGDNEFYMRNLASDGDDPSWASFHIFIAEKPQDAPDAIGVSSSDNAAAIKSKIENAPSGAVVTFEDGRYDSIGKIAISKPLTLKSATGDQNDSDAIFRGDITFDIRSSNVRVAGLEFVGVTSEAPVQVPWITVSDVVIEKNLFDGTSNFGVYRFNDKKTDTDSLDKGTYAERLTVDQNVFKDIGFQGMSSAEKTAVTDDKIIPAGSKGTAIKIDGVRDSVISDNEIDKSTGSGILLNFAEDVTVKGNTIKNVIKDGIKVDRSASGIIIDDNDITNSAYADRFTDNDTDTTTIKPIDSAYAAIAILKADDAVVRDNTITESKTGILFCKGTCDVNYDPIPMSDSRSYSEGPSTGHVTGNILKDIGMQYIVNADPDERLPAQLNYFDAADPDSKIKGKVYYGPWYDDEALTTLSTTGTAVQISNARAFSSSTCSISLEHSSMTFSNTIYGQNSDTETQSVANEGSSDLTGIMLESTGWKKADGTVLSTVHTDVKETGTDDYQKLSSTDTASFDTNLAASSAEKLSLEFVMDLRDATSGPAEELTENVTYLASCS